MGGALFPMFKMGCFMFKKKTKIRNNNYIEIKNAVALYLSIYQVILSLLRIGTGVGGTKRFKYTQRCMLYIL